MDDYEITFQTWNQLSQWYEDVFMELDIYSDTYKQFCQAIVKQNAHILEIGCGPGNVTKRLLELRPNYNILATDISSNMLKYAKKNNPMVEVQVLDAREINQLKNKFDGLMAGFCLPYLSQTDIIKLIKDAALLLNQNGVIYLSCIEGEYSKSGMYTNGNGQKSLMFYYDSNFLIEELTRNGFVQTEIHRILYPNSEQLIATHLVLIAKRI